MEAPIRPTTCNRCGKHFNAPADRVPRFCSIACEEGRGPLPDSDPSSPFFHRHIQGNPHAIVGHHIQSKGLKRTCYSPNWHKSPDEYRNVDIIEHDSENEILVLKRQQHLGKVKEIDGNTAIIEKWTVEEDKHIKIEVSMSTVVSMLRQDLWWSDGR